MFTLTYLTAHGQHKTLTFHTAESYQVAILMCEQGGLEVIRSN